MTGERRGTPGTAIFALPLLAYAILMLLAFTEGGREYANRVLEESRSRILSMAGGTSSGWSGVSTWRPSLLGSEAIGATPRGGALPLAFGRDRNRNLESIELAGNQREEIEDMIAAVSETYGRSTRDAIRRIEYNPDSNLTRVIVDTESPAWRAYFSDRMTRRHPTNGLDGL